MKPSWICKLFQYSVQPQNTGMPYTKYYIVICSFHSILPTLTKENLSVHTEQKSIVLSPIDEIKKEQKEDED